VDSGIRFAVERIRSPRQIVMALLISSRRRNSFSRRSLTLDTETFLAIAKDLKMKALSASIIAVTVLLGGAAYAQVGAGAQVGPVGAGASTGPGGVGAGAHVGGLGVHVGVSNPFYHRTCHGGWYWRNHHHYCRRW
jgi:hypothetical protein